MAKTKSSEQGKVFRHEIRRLTPSEIDKVVGAGGGPNPGYKDPGGADYAAKTFT